MIYVNFPVSSMHGWGVCGKYITKELLKHTTVKLITDNLAQNLANDPFAAYILQNCLADKELFDEIASKKEILLDAPLISCVASIEFNPLLTNLKGTKNYGYTFFEQDIIPHMYIENAKKNFDHIIAGSSWCEEVLRGYGLENISTIIQGIDPQIFNPCNNEKQNLKNKFVIFSGGKFELRKGQDIVINAVKTLQEKYDDVVLINSWFNFWESSFMTMAESKLIDFPSTKESPLNLREKQWHVLQYIMVTNGINMNNVITLPPLPNATMASIYKNTDIGLFPNRCEGGTNLVLMEYMACGKPVVASYNTGHKDILTDENSVPIKNMTKDNWFEPDINEVIEHLEKAYLDWSKNKSAKLIKISKKAGEDLSGITWTKTAEKFYETVAEGK